MKTNFFLMFSLIGLLLAACGGATGTSGSEDMRPALDFTLPNALDGEVSLSDYAGQPVLLYFHMAVG